MGSSERLNIYIENLVDIPFEWGVNDCFTFTNGAFRAMYGRGYADEWTGRYMQSNKVYPKGLSSLRHDYGYNNIEEALEDKLVKLNAPTLGCLVTTKKNQRWVTGVALGISIGSRAVFLGQEGLIRLNIKDVESAWALK
jgi:hypothetical protein